MSERHYLDDFLNMMQAERSASRHTLAAYRRDISQLYRYLEDRQFSVSSVPQVALEVYLRQLTGKRHLAASTCARKLSGIRHFFRFLVSENIRDDNPATYIDSPRQEKHLPNTISQEEVEILLTCSAEDESSEGKRLHTLLHILYASGLRVTELVSLKLTSIQITEGEDGPVAHLLIRGKGNKERLVPMHEGAIRALYTYLRVRAEFEQGDDETHWLFPSHSKSGHLTRQRFGQILKSLALKAGLDPAKIHPHALRHSFASHMLAGGADLRVVQELLGHADISTTQIYTHVLKEHLQELVETHHPLADADIS